MFTGIVQDLGRIEQRETHGGDVRLVIGYARLEAARVQPGDSVCVQGCCLTVTARAERSFAADLSRETLARTTLGALAVGAAVNLEPSLRAGDALGGHYVTGHVDGLARLVSAEDDGRSLRLVFEVPADVFGQTAGGLVPAGAVLLQGSHHDPVQVAPDLA